jgi:hypothetical protein
MIGVRFPVGAGNFSLRHRVQTGSGTYPASYPMGNGGFLIGVKRPGREADHLPPSSAKVKECVELYLQSPIRLHGMVLSYTQGQLYFYLTLSVLGWLPVTVVKADLYVCPNG